MMNESMVDMMRGSMTEVKVDDDNDNDNDNDNNNYLLIFIFQIASLNPANNVLF
jgi:hypothetical protein